MSKILNLTYNEILKQIKKTSIKVIIGLILILSIILPVIINIAKPIDYSKRNLENFNSMLNHINREMENIKSDKTEEGKILKNNLELQKKRMELEKDEKVVYNDWRIGEVENYRNIYAQILSLKEVLNNTDKNILFKNADGIDQSEFEAYYELPQEEIKKEINILESKLEESKNIVVKKDYIKYLQNHINNTEKFIKERKLELEELKKQLEKDPKNEVVKENIKHITTMISRTQSLINIDKYRLRNKIDFEEDNWKNNTLNKIKKDVEKLNEPMLNQDEFINNASVLNIKMNYEKYKQEYEENTKQLKNNIKINWYSLENNMPQLESVKDARSVLNNIYNVYVILAILLVIIIGSGIIATEFSKGTIRLLLIRPVSRGKILFSKLLALLMIGYGIIIGALIISIISSGILFGFKTFSIPILKLVSEKIIEVNFIQYLSQNIFIVTTSFVFITSVVFMLSIITKNIAISVAVSMLIYLGAMPATLILSGLNFNWISNTFIPYINQSLFRLMPFLTETIKSQSGIRFNPYSGGIQLIILSIVMLVISFVVFNKKDIKN